MREIVWSETARADLQGIYDFVARDSAALADQMIYRLVLAAERAAELPYSGRVVAEFASPDIRETREGSYCGVSCG